MPLLRPCKTTAAFEALPDAGRLEVDLDELQQQLVETGWDLVVNAHVMLIVRRELELSVYRSGKMLLKTRDVEAAVRTVREVHPFLEPDQPHEPTIEGLDRLDRHDTSAIAAQRHGAKAVRSAASPQGSP